jgi:hypothetical protein
MGEHAGWVDGWLSFLERHTRIIYPALAIGVLALMVVAIIRAWKELDSAGVAKAERKRQILTHLRRQPAGASAEALAKEMGLQSFKVVKLLEEMQDDGLLSSHTNTQRLTLWQLKR